MRRSRPGDAQLTASRTCRTGMIAEPLDRRRYALGGEDHAASGRSGRGEPLRDRRRRPHQPRRAPPHRRTRRRPAGGCRSPRKRVRPPPPGRTPDRRPSRPPTTPRTARPGRAGSRRPVEDRRHQLEPSWVEPRRLAAARAVGRTRRAPVPRPRGPGARPAATRSRHPPPDRRSRAGPSDRSRGGPRSPSRTRPTPLRRRTGSCLPRARGAPTGDRRRTSGPTSTACSSARGPARSPSFVTCPVSTHGDALGLREPHQRVGARAHLRDAARHLRARCVADRLDRVDRQEERPGLTRELAPRARDRDPARTRSASIVDAETTGASGHLRVGFLTAHEQRRVPGGGEMAERDAAGGSTCRSRARPRGAPPTREPARPPGPGRSRRSRR